MGRSGAGAGERARGRLFDPHARPGDLEDGKPALTRFKLVQAYRDCCYAEVRLFTGRTHQIRAHARHIGLPLAGDDRYADRESIKKWKKRGLGRIFLHAHRMELAAPSGQHLSLDAPLPATLRKVLDRLEQ